MSISVSRPKNLAWTQQEVDSMNHETITSQAEGYNPAERAEKLLLFLLYPCLLCVLNCGTHLWYGLHLGKEDLKAYAVCLLILLGPPCHLSTLN
jgi:hypothetical protein